MTAVILGGQTLASVNPGTLPLVVGIIIIGILSLLPCFVGYHLVHYYERYAWIVIFVIIMFLWGLGGKAGYDINAQKPYEDTGRAFSADILSFGGIVFGSVYGVRPSLPSRARRPVLIAPCAVDSGRPSRRTTTAGCPQTRRARRSSCSPSSGSGSRSASSRSLVQR